HLRQRWRRGRQVRRDLGPADVHPDVRSPRHCPGRLDQRRSIGAGPVRRLSRRFARHQGGASALEFALVAVPLLLIIVGTVEYGRALWTQQAMQSLAISSARCIGVAQTECTTSGSHSVTKTRAHVIAEAAKLGVGLQSGNITINANTSCRGVAGF